MEKQKCYMLDTSAILDDPFNMVRLYDNGQNQIFINNIVYAEMNRKKKESNSDAGANAREFFRLLNDQPLEKINIEDTPACLQDKLKTFSESNGDKLIKFNLKKDGQSVVLYMISRKKFRVNGKTLEEVEESDMKIAEVALDYDLTMITNDAGLHMHMQMNEGRSEFLLNDAIDSIESLCFEKNITVYHQDIKDMSAEKLEVYFSSLKECADAKNFTQFTFVEKDFQDETEYETGRIFWAIKKLNFISLVENPSDESYSLKHTSVRPINKEQAMYQSILMAPDAKVVVVSGATGSGKTLIALSAGIEMVNSGLVDGIVYTRNTVTATDRESELGFRKGGEEQKLGYFMYPLYSAVNFMIEQAKKTPGISFKAHSKYAGESNSMEKENATEIFMKEHNITVMDIAHLRGATINNKLIIIDEAQNMTAASIKLVGTRVGEGARLIVMGDVNQIDHPYLSKKRNALTRMLSIALKDNFLAGVFLLKTVRSDVAEWFDTSL